jgi:hypothetical protein
VVRTRPMPSGFHVSILASSSAGRGRRRSDVVGRPARQILFIETIMLRTSFPSGTMVTD